MDVSRPPGVSRRSMTTGAPEASARAIPWTTWAALTAWMTPFTSTTGTTAPAGNAHTAPSRTTGARHCGNRMGKYRAPDTIGSRKPTGLALSCAADATALESILRDWSNRGVMFGTLGGPELLLIFVIALIVFGPRKLPEIGKSVGKMMAEFRRASNDFQRTIEEEVEADKMRNVLEPPRTEEPPPPTE